MNLPEEIFIQENQSDAPLTNYGNGLNDAGAGGDNNLAMLEKSIPGVPGQDYPILAEVPESSFSCDGQVDGGGNFVINF